MIIGDEDKQSVLVFVHVPKTAGSSIRHVLARMYEARQELVFDGRFSTFKVTLDWVVANPNMDIRLIYGHVPFGVAEKMGRSGKYFTFLRDPFKRFVSDFYFSSHPESGFYDLMQNRHTLSNFIALNSPYLKNPQCRWIAGYHPLEDAPEDPELFELAKINLLNNFSSFGITEFFDESLLLIASDLKLPLPIYLQSNTSTRAHEVPISASERHSIDQLNSCDIKLYKFALNLFLNRLKLDANFRSVVKDFKELLGRHKSFYSGFEPSGTYVPQRDGIFPLHDSLSVTREYQRVQGFLERG